MPVAEAAGGDFVLGTEAPAFGVSSPALGDCRRAAASRLAARSAATFVSTWLGGMTGPDRIPPLRSSLSLDRPVDALDTNHLVAARTLGRCHFAAHV